MPAPTPEVMSWWRLRLERDLWDKVGEDGVGLMFWRGRSMVANGMNGV